VSVIDGAGDTVIATPTVGNGAYSVAVNPVTNKVYAANYISNSVSVIDGASDSVIATPAVGTNATALAVNPVTSRVYVANEGDNSVSVIDDAPASDTRVRASVFRTSADSLLGDTTSQARPALSGKGVCRLTPPAGHDSLLGVYCKLNTTQQALTKATLTPTSRPDSVVWTYNWGADSLIWGENYVCAVALEADGATTNNCGLGSPFAGNVLVYPIYRMPVPTGSREAGPGKTARNFSGPTVIRSVLQLPAVSGQRSAASELLNISGRKVLGLHSGANDVSRLSPGVYFVEERAGGDRGPAEVQKVILTR
jgi:YVTN family beta-propeller protein